MSTVPIKIPVSFDTFSSNNTRSKPINGISPKHQSVKYWIFTYNEHEKTTPGEESESYIQATLEANLADAMARVAEINGVDINTLQHLFPAVLRMLKSDSRWAK